MGGLYLWWNGYRFALQNDHRLSTASFSRRTQPVCLMQAATKRHLKRNWKPQFSLWKGRQSLPAVSFTKLRHQHFKPTYVRMFKNPPTTLIYAYIYPYCTYQKYLNPSLITILDPDAHLWSTHTDTHNKQSTSPRKRPGNDAQETGMWGPQNTQCTQCGAHEARNSWQMTPAAMEELKIGDQRRRVVN